MSQVEREATGKADRQEGRQARTGAKRRKREWMKEKTENTDSAADPADSALMQTRNEVGGYTRRGKKKIKSIHGQR